MARLVQKSVTQLALAYYTAGGDGEDTIQREGDAQNRLRCEASAVRTVRGARLTVQFRGLRHDLEEVVQALTREETLGVLAAVLARGGLRGAASHLLEPHAMASRSPTVYWNAVHLFGTVRAAAEAAKAEAEED